MAEGMDRAKAWGGNTVKKKYEDRWGDESRCKQGGLGKKINKKNTDRVIYI